VRRFLRRLAVLMLLGFGLGPSTIVDGQIRDDVGEEEFLRQHWRLPIPPQGRAPERFTGIEGSPDPESCGICHPAQLADWRTSLHARSMGSGVKGQLIELIESDPASALHCYGCHAPLSEQQEKVEENGAYRVNQAFDGGLQRHGLTCAGCHVRRHERFGPPKRDGSLASDLPREQLPHGGVTRTPAFVRSEFCKECHQFAEAGYALNGKLLENTFNEWRAGPFGQAGVQCQECHMPDRRHLWRGIHDPEMVRSGVTITLTTDKQRYRRGESVSARLTITNKNIGHHFPTYVTPRVVARIELRDAKGRVVPGSREERRIGREVTLDLSREITDTRLAPGGSLVFQYRRRLDQVGLRLKLTVTVYPDHFYTGFFRSLLAQGAGKGTAQIRQALAVTQRSHFVVYDRELPLI